LASASSSIAIQRQP